MKPGQRKHPCYVSCWAPGQRWHLPAEPSTLARLALRAQASRKEKRPHHPSSTPLSLHDGNLASDSWWNPQPANQSVSEREM